MKIIFAFTIAVLALSAKSDDVLVCTQDVGILVNDLFLVIEAFEKDPFKPSADALKQLLAGIQKLLNECAHIPIDLSPYNACIDDSITLIPQIKKLVVDIQNNDQTEILIDVTSLALAAITTATQCAKKPNNALTF